MTQLAISDVAEQTGIAAGTLRMWEQRYGFPEPERTETGYRRYPAEVVGVLRRVIELRDRGMSMPAAIEQARQVEVIATDRPSIYATLARSMQPRTLSKRTLVALSRAIEDEAVALAAAPVAFGAFQLERFYRQSEARYQAMARLADAVSVFADFPQLTREGRILQVPIGPEDALGNEWIVIVDAPAYAACLLAWEPAGGAEPGGPGDGQRRFEAIWTMDAEITRQAALTAARLVARADAAEGERLQALLERRPLAMQSVAPALTALTNRIVAYLD